jgi:hypothetical protein
MIEACVREQNNEERLSKETQVLTENLKTAEIMFQLHNTLQQTTWFGPDSAPAMLQDAIALFERGKMTIVDLTPSASRN